MRFRNYLGEQYKRQDEVRDNGVTKKMALPIVSIYLLGFKLAGLPTPLLKVSRQYVDQISHRVIDHKDDFIEKLTHDCYVVQIPLIDGKLFTRVERTLSFFEQKYFVDDTGIVKEYPYPIEGEDMKLIAEALHYAGTDPEKRKVLAVEREAMREYYAINEKLQEQIQEKDKKIQEKDKAISEKDKTISEKDKEIEDLKRQLGL